MNLADLPASELVRLHPSGEVTARPRSSRTRLDRIAERDPGAERVLGGAGRRGPRRGRASSTTARRRRRAGPLHGVPVAIKEEVDVAGCVTTFGGRANSTPAAADGEVVRRLRAAGAVIIGKTRMPEFGQWPFTESRRRRDHPQPVGPQPHPGRLQRRHRGRGRRRDGAGRHRRRRRRVDPDPVGLLRAVRAQAAARPGDQRRRCEHLWWALGTTGPLTRTVLDSALVYDVIRGNLGRRPVTRAPSRATSFVDAAPVPSPAGCGSAGRHVPVTKGVRPAPEHVEAVRETAQLLTDLGHDVRRGRPALPRPDAARSSRSSSPASAPRPTRWSTSTGSSGAPARPTGSALGRPRGSSRGALRPGEQVAERRPTGSSTSVDVLLTPTIAHRPRAGRCARQGRHRPRRRCGRSRWSPTRRCGT